MKRTDQFFFLFLCIATMFVGPCLAQITTATPPSASSRWPMQLDTPDGQLTVYQPQPTKFDGDKLTGRAAVSLVKSGAAEPIFGAIWLESRVSTDRVQRTVEILDVKVTRVRFPEGTDISADAITNALSAALPAHEMSLSLDQLIAMVEEVEQERQSIQDLSNTPPKIIFQTHPGVLIQYDGEPRFSNVSNSNLLRADNTPFFVVEDPASKTFFIKGAGRWFSARTPLGPFQLTSSVPAQMAALANSSGYQDPEQPLTDQEAAQMEVIAATEPTELIWTDGPMQMGTIPNTNLLYIMNTDSDVFRVIDSQAWYVLLSGRWFTASSQNGPWSFVPSDKLPDDFKHIPPASAKAEVLASIAGTQQAQDAIADTFVPQTAAIDRNNFEQPPVAYDGSPDFEPIVGTPMEYAVNTPDSVILVSGRYYCCYGGVWYESAIATGPWGLCVAVPAVIYTIPPSCPLFPCRYCFVYGVTPEYCYVGYTPGYTGCYRYGHVVVYGTGWRYRPWIGHHHFYARPFTYGFDAHYDTYTGFWGFHVSVHTEHGSAWIGSRNKDIVRPAWFGHGGFRSPVVHRDVYQHRDVYERPTARPTDWNLYARRHDVHQEFHGRPEEHHETQTNGRQTPPKPTPVQATPGRIGQSHPEDVYAAPNGDIYRRTDRGWEQRQNNRWVTAPEPSRHEEDHGAQQPSRPEPSHHEEPHGNPQASPSAPAHAESPRSQDSSLNRDYRARQFGEDRARIFQRSETPTQQQQQQSQPPAPSPSHSGAGRTGGGNYNR
ncbi:MAG TPA: hypothetical protein VG722_08135 [Tepidisphaeraceae bacterium]|nr:hypothetical protein [Tepidisphaeraceae bacterium]